MIKQIRPNNEHIKNLNDAQRASNAKNIEKLLDDIFRNGIKDPVQIPYVNQLLKNYYDLTNKDYKIKKENTIV